MYSHFSWHKRGPRCKAAARYDSEYTHLLWISEMGKFKRVSCCWKDQSKRKRQYRRIVEM